VIKRVCNHFVGIAREVMEDMMGFDPQKNVKEMWIGGHLECDRETLIKLWNDTLSKTFHQKRCDSFVFLLTRSIFNRDVSVPGHKISS